MRYLVSDPESSVRSVAAQSITLIANLATKYTEMGLTLRARNLHEPEYGESYSEASYSLFQ